MKYHHQLLIDLVFIIATAMPFSAVGTENIDKNIGYIELLRGSWEDRTHQKNMLSEGEQIYSDSVIRRVNQGNTSDSISFRIYHCKEPVEFKCLKPKICVGALDIKHALKKCDRNILEKFNDIIATLKSQPLTSWKSFISRGDAINNDKVQDAVVSINDNSISIGQAFANLEPGSYELAYKLMLDENSEYTEQKVKWTGKKEASLALKIEPGIYKLKVSGESGLIDDDSIILAVPKSKYFEVSSFMDEGKNYLETVLGKDNLSEKKRLLRYLLLSKDPRKTQ